MATQEITDLTQQRPSEMESQEFYKEEILETIWGNKKALGQQLGDAWQGQDLSSISWEQSLGSLATRDMSEDSEDSQLLSKVSEPAVKEVILGWWRGEVVSTNGNTFQAQLVDLDGKESVAEVERGAVGHAQQSDIRIGARFIYSVWRQERPDRTVTESSLQFLPSHIWSQKDEEYIDKRIRELYDDDKGWISK